MYYIIERYHSPDWHAIELNTVMYRHFAILYNASQSYRVALNV